MGARINRDPLDSLPEDITLRPIGDKVIIQVDPDQYDTALAIVSADRPLRGTVVAIGPGELVKKYRHRWVYSQGRETQERTESYWSTTFRATQTQVGDRVELGGRDIGGYLFDKLRIGGKDHVICTERDIAAIYE